jgi:molybdopterin converting factor small subunit
MQITVHFYSYFKDLTGCIESRQTVPDEQTLGELLDDLGRQFPKLAPMRKSMLAAVGVDYQTRDYRLKEGDEVSLFPPVQGG